MNWEADVDFCPHVGDLTTQQLSTRLGLDLFCSSFLEELFNARYKQMKKNFRNVSCADYGVPDCGFNLEAGKISNVNDPHKPDARLGVAVELINSGVDEFRALWGYPSLGHDLPVWLSNDNPKLTKGKIMIISEDPLRDDDAGVLTISTPFGVHCSTYREHTRSDIAFRLIENLLSSYGMVYITDARKMYAGKNGKILKDAVRRKPYDSNFFRMVFDHMIEVEISSFRPDLILTLGNTVVENCFTSSVLSSAHLPKDGCEVQVIHGDGHEPLHVLTSFHPSFRKNRIKNKAGEITPAARTSFGFPSVMKMMMLTISLKNISRRFLLTLKNPWASLLVENPEFADRCNWGKLDDWDWSHLLCKRPDFADRCVWEKLGGCAWASLLAEHPKFSDKCAWDKLDGWHWCELLTRRPEFADKCAWDKLNGCDWSRLLIERPEFVERCAWDKLDGWDWERLLKSQPQFESRRILSGWDWVRKLNADPQLADKCEWGKLDGWDWAKLLSNKPQFAEKCNWEKLDNGDWLFLLGRQPQFAEKCESMGMKPLVQDSEDGAEKASDVGLAQTELYVDAIVRSHGVCFYPDVEDVERLIEDNEPVPNLLPRKPFPEGCDSLFIGRCTIDFENENGEECRVVVESSLTESVSSLYCCEEGGDVDLSKVEIMENGAKVDSLEKLGEKKDVPVEYAQEERRCSCSFSTNGNFDPRKLTLVIENGFLEGVQYCGRDVVTADSVYDGGDYLCDMYSIEYRYLNDGHIHDGKQEIMF